MHSRIIFPAIFLAIFSPVESHAGTAIQTDWSGRVGIIGPVIDFGDDFYLGRDIECYSAPSNVVLLKSTLKHTVERDFDGARSVYSADINGDGYVDILGASSRINKITLWDLNAFHPEGSFVSSVLDVQESPDWQTIDWTCTEPAGTGIVLQVRASDDPSSMGAWSDTLTSPCNLEGILTDGDLNFQYRVILTTTDLNATPVLHDITLLWQPFSGTQ